MLEGQPPMRLAMKDISLAVGNSSTFSFTVDKGNPHSNMTITGPNQPHNNRVSISSSGVVNISMVRLDDNGTHIAKWWNGIGDAKFTLNLRVDREPGKSVHVLT